MQKQASSLPKTIQEITKRIFNCLQILPEERHSRIDDTHFSVFFPSVSIQYKQTIIDKSPKSISDCF